RSLRVVGDVSRLARSQAGGGRRVRLPDRPGSRWLRGQGGRRPRGCGGEQAEPRDVSGSDTCQGGGPGHGTNEGSSLVIASIRGTVVEIGLERCVMETSGVGVLVHSSPADLAGLRRCNVCALYSELWMWVD